MRTVVIMQDGPEGTTGRGEQLMRDMGETTRELGALLAKNVLDSGHVECTSVVNRAFSPMAEYQEHWHAQDGGRSAENATPGRARLCVLRKPPESQKPDRSGGPITESGLLERLRWQNDEALVTFLEVDLDLSDTILKTAEMAISPLSAGMALERVRQSIRTIRRLGSRIKSPAATIRIQDRTNRVERRLNSIARAYQPDSLQP
jgi:hypothetical protein